LKIPFDKNPLAETMVKYQIEGRGIRDRSVLEAMRKIPRHLFVGGGRPSDAYRDSPLPIGHGQTISQPYMVAVMSEALELNERDKVLEIGTGSGYQTAVLAYIAREVYTVERIEPLLKRAKAILSGMGFTNIHYKLADGNWGWEEEAPFDKIIVTAAASEVPPALKRQLGDNGKLVIPVGDYKSFQELFIIERVGNSYTVEKSIACRFVPLLDGIER